MTWTLESPEMLETVARELITALGNRKKIALYGEMGAGKTTFAKAFCKVLGVEGGTASPTFSLINAYPVTDASGAPATIHHLDLYRLRSVIEALDIGIEEVLYDPWYCLIEWPQVIEPILPDDCAVVTIEIVNENARVIRLT